MSSSTVDNPEAVKRYFRAREDIDTRKKEISDERKELKAEFKGENFDMTALEAAYKISQMDEDDKAESEFLIDAYLSASKEG